MLMAASKEEPELPMTEGQDLQFIHTMHIRIPHLVSTVAKNTFSLA
jgi:hypothetical protein